MQVIRLTGPSRLLPYLFPDLWLLYRFYISARAGDVTARQRAEREAAIHQKREREEQEQREHRKRMKELGVTDDDFSMFDINIRDFMQNAKHQAYQGAGSTPNTAQAQTASTAQSQQRAASTASSPPPPPYTQTELERDLNAIIGLENVKQAIRDIHAQVTIQQQRIAQGLSAKNSAMSLHMLFLGNPGTGKTTVARLIGDMFKKMGVLSKGHFIETDPTGLIGQYLGQTRGQTEAKIKEAIGGVLFVDEAYAIIDPENHSGTNSYGKEAIQVLIKQMEDHRNDLCVIYAGYTNEMESFIRTNPGMESRIAFRLHFDDYSPADLMKIIQKMCNDRNLHFDNAAQDYLRSLFAKNATRIGSLGNGRWARNVLEAAIRKQSRRLAGNQNNSREALQTITVADVVAWEEENKANDRH